MNVEWVIDCLIDYFNRKTLSKPISNMTMYYYRWIIDYSCGLICQNYHFLYRNHYNRTTIQYIHQKLLIGMKCIEFCVLLHVVWVWIISNLDFKSRNCQVGDNAFVLEWLQPPLKKSPNDNIMLLLVSTTGLVLIIVPIELADGYLILIGYIEYLIFSK